MLNRMKEKCDIIHRSRWYYRCGTQIVPAECVSTSISRHSEDGHVNVDKSWHFVPDSVFLLDISIQQIFMFFGSNYFIVACQQHDNNLFSENIQKFLRNRDWSNVQGLVLAKTVCRRHPGRHWCWLQKQKMHLMKTLTKAKWTIIRSLVITI